MKGHIVAPGHIRVKRKNEHPLRDLLWLQARAAANRTLRRAGHRLGTWRTEGAGTKDRQDYGRCMSCGCGLVRLRLGSGAWPVSFDGPILRNCPAPRTPRRVRRRGALCPYGVLVYYVRAQGTPPRRPHDPEARAQRLSDLLDGWLTEDADDDDVDRPGGENPP